ncbi:acetyltransferase, GNAT family protein [Entamoeba histolytica HM-1:IMSS-B]|uniref:Acetyltransferase, GNAT family n=7 Tax=Entamoeba TaxID=5758 RepID=C4LZF4_ENTH1|nr:acetyltransferase, GNAT family protein [Entamoeba nuttalli P19]XP_654064.2 acetyltransferase, GNAT family [Entamoeba histolytica HM-1:IMSS]EMD45676.1 acetyltransferase GNAT family protein, putative [Entamoeba histolytica KU27]EMH72816.1 acetyltransferase, GNAT family protein [Entamoeba histolytica HM-1:IMSS-B]EMS13095.1 acetyltransferase, GNAT family protein [Entamoeba histolytica HM-3:IMSS]ENY64172.1 acetyltransferase, GNAT family protein, putative [Entamoeba histolytica HM-1:IMSS-A]GAT94|eukprot:XP_008855806.1 acetyltransferase, GNAT family protein [Entamoeba nuttalli P19]
MTTIRKFKCRDILEYSNVNLDYYTETFHFPFYFEYLSKWPEMCFIARDCNGRVEGYHFGKIEGEGEKYHGHLTAITIAREFRRIGLSNQLMFWLKQISEEANCYYVDLFVRKSNETAIGMYHRLGYSVYREILEYYSSNNESAYDMRTSLPRDVDKKSIIPLPKPIYADEADDL